MKNRFTKMTPAKYRASGKEKDIEAGICDLLGLCGIPFSKTDAALTFHEGKLVGRSVTTAGWPDVTACLPPNGRLLAIETKTAKGRVRDSQKYFLPILEGAGALVCIPRSLEEFAQVLIAAGIKHQALTALCGKNNAA